ncbi:MAG: AtzE family amidohydrolase [Pseudomonadales bacterium]|nr:AtzE family amidohydrolase [Pseudomonadales bacterium]
MSNSDGDASGLDIASAVAAKRLSAQDAVATCLARIEALNPRINAFTAVHTDRALARAQAVDQRVQDGQQLPLAGVPFAVKNLFDIEDQTTLAGSKINQQNAVADSDALMIQRIEAAGGVLVGALNMGEFAYDFTGENQHYGDCRNPWNLAHMTGGSSSGSGAALASGMVPLTLGSDTNGSIRVPSALCGTYGLKPTYGRLPRTGSYPFCDSLDHVGPMARSVAELAVAYNVMQGFDATDHVCVARQPDLVDVQATDGKTLRIGVLQGYFAPAEFDEATQVVADCAKALEAMGVAVADCELNLAQAGRSAAFLITNIEGASLHYEKILQRADDFDPDTRDRFIAGSLLPASWYARAQRVRRQYANEAAELFRHFDVLLAPATPIRAPLRGQKNMSMGGSQVNVRANLGYFTQPISCIGLPVVCAPVMQSQFGTPQAAGSASATAATPSMGVQIIAAPWREDLCFKVASLLAAASVTRSEVAPVSTQD